MISTTFLLLCRVLVVAVHKTCKAASGGITRLCDQSLWFGKTLSCHWKGSGAIDWRSNHYHLYSIISLPFSFKFRLRCTQHPWRWRGSGRPPQCWRDTSGTCLVFLPPKIQHLYQAHQVARREVQSHSMEFIVGFALGTNSRGRGNRYRTPTSYPKCCTRQRKVYIANKKKEGLKMITTQT